MKTFLLRVLGLRYPSVAHALNKNSDECVRVAYDSYVVKNRSGLATAINHYLKTNYDMVSPNDRTGVVKIRAKLLESSTELLYPCVVWVSPESLESLHVDYDQSDAYGD